LFRDANATGLFARDEATHLGRRELDDVRLIVNLALFFGLPSGLAIAPRSVATICMVLEYEKYQNSFIFFTRALCKYLSESCNISAYGIANIPFKGDDEVDYQRERA
jgi:hypothetical protein